MNKKPYPKVRMVCAICHRPMAKAAALSGGLPVGPVCAANAGLLEPKPQRAAHDAPVRDNLTIDIRSMKDKTKSAQALLLACLPATQADMRAKTGMSQATISRWIVFSRACNEVHIGSWETSADHRAIVRAVYHAGPGPDVDCDITGLTDDERERLTERNRRKTGDHGDQRLAAMAKPPRRSMPKPHPLMALFGRA